jgi:hypothetical protein
MEILKIEEVIEENYYDFNLMWELVEEKDDTVIFRFCPRLNNGGDRQVGFEITLSTSNWNWKYFHENVLCNKHFINAYWIRFRLGFSIESYWFKIVDKFKHEFEDCPFETSSSNFCRLHPEAEYLTFLLNNGVEFKENSKIGYCRYTTPIKGVVYEND